MQCLIICPIQGCYLLIHYTHTSTFQCKVMEGYLMPVTDHYSLEMSSFVYHVHPDQNHSDPASKTSRWLGIIRSYPLNVSYLFIVLSLLGIFIIFSLSHTIVTGFLALLVATLSDRLHQSIP